MGIGGDIKTKKFIRVLEKISLKTDLEILEGGRHNYKLKVIHTGNTFPVPGSHPKIKKTIVKAIGKWLEKNEVCSYSEFENYCSSV